LTQAVDGSARFHGSLRSMRNEQQGIAHIDGALAPALLLSRLLLAA
jgi:hypothetical protein